MFVLDESYDVLLTFSPMDEVSGHWFEMFEYYAYLKEHGFRPFMLFFSPMKKEIIRKTLEDKYNYPLADFDCIFNEKIIACPHAVCIVCDGNFSSIQQKSINIISRKTLGFGCGYAEYPGRNITYLLDTRIYGKVPYGVHYTKKIFADIIKVPEKCNENIGLFYLKRMCRKVEKSFIAEAIADLKQFDRFVIMSHHLEDYSGISQKIDLVNIPCQNFFENFSAYIYTPVPRKFDCSPRLIAECNLFGRDVIYYKIDYTDEGLETRKKDIEDGSCWMRENDQIIEIIRKFL